MNIYAIIILGTLVLHYALNVLADYYNLRALRHELPGECTDVYDADAYRTSQDYTRAQTRLGMLTSTCMLLITLAFWFSSGFQALDVLGRGWQWPLIWSGLGV
jgi:STE24 endopeptidase